jgi:hypothetical protein
MKAPLCATQTARPKYFLAEQSVEEEKSAMDPSERRVVGSLLLLSSLTLLTLGLYTGQLEFVLEIVKKIFRTAVAGAP